MFLHYRLLFLFVLDVHLAQTKLYYISFTLVSVMIKVWLSLVFYCDFVMFVKFERKNHCTTRILSIIQSMRFMPIIIIIKKNYVYWVGIEKQNTNTGIFSTLIIPPITFWRISASQEPLFSCTRCVIWWSSRDALRPSKL